MKLYALDCDWRGGYAVVAKSPEEALRKMTNHWHQQSKVGLDVEESDLVLANVKEYGLDAVVHFVGES